MTLGFLLSCAGWTSSSEEPERSATSQKLSLIVPEEDPFYAASETVSGVQDGARPFSVTSRYAEKDPENMPSCFDMLYLVPGSVTDPERVASTLNPVEACASSDNAQETAWTFQCTLEQGYATYFGDEVKTGHGKIPVMTCAGLNCLMHQIEDETRRACRADSPEFNVDHCEDMLALNGGRTAKTALER